MSKKMSQRTFGVEIECVGLDMTQAIQALRAAKISVHDGRASWTVKTDCSVMDVEFSSPGVEVVSPILTGQAGLKEVQKVARALRKAGGRANSTCGLHVHVGARDLSPLHVQTIISRYAAFEPMIDAILPTSRRNNQFALPMANLLSVRPDVLNTAPSVANIANLLSTRYYRVNVLSYLRHGTLEFRQHSGSVEAEVITNWILFVLNFVEASTPPATRSATGPKTRTKGPRANARTKGLVKILKVLLGETNDALGRPMGATEANLSIASGYSRVSIPAVICELRKTYRLKIQKVRANRYCSGWYRFSAFQDLETVRNLVRTMTANEVSSAPVASGRAVLPVFSEDSALRGLPTDVVAFFLERRSEFGLGR